MKRLYEALLVGGAICFLPALADAHISVASGPGFANVSQEITFGVGHGCAGVDTYSVRIEIPAGVTGVRTETSDFGKATVEMDAAGTTVTAVTWQKADADTLPSDTAYYKLTIRAKLPNTPFTTLYFVAHQTCKGPDGGISTVDWSSLVATAPDGAALEPAPALLLLPARRPGWNKFTVPAAVTDIASFFGDALIVWKGTAAYSANPVTADLIKTTAGVTALTALAANDEIWVKY